jgi:hypothetical protein
MSSLTCSTTPTIGVGENSLSSNGHNPSANGQRPRSTGQGPPANGHPTGQRPAATGQRPPASSHRPAATSQQPPASGHHPAAGGHLPPLLSFSISLFIFTFFPLLLRLLRFTLLLPPFSFVFFVSLFIFIFFPLHHPHVSPLIYLRGADVLIYHRRLRRKHPQCSRTRDTIACTMLRDVPVSR